MNQHLLHQAFRHYEAKIRTYFDRLSDEDVQAILAGPGETLLVVLQRRYGYSQAEAKAAWNEFVLRHIDGNESAAKAGVRGAHRSYAGCAHAIPTERQIRSQKLCCCERLVVHVLVPQQDLLPM